MNEASLARLASELGVSREDASERVVRGFRRGQRPGRKRTLQVGKRTRKSADIQLERELGRPARNQAGLNPATTSMWDSLYIHWEKTL